MKQILNAFLLCLLTITSCKKSDSPNSGTINPPPSNVKDITLITTSAVPGEVVTAIANFKPATDSLSVFIQGKRVMAGVTDSNEIVFILPSLPQGNASIDYKNSGVSKSLVITINAYVPISQPDAIINNFTSKIGQIILYFEEYERNSNIKFPVEHGDLLSYLRQIQTTSYSTLSNQDKIEFATFIQVNMPNESDYKLDTLNNNFYSRTQNNEISPTERIWNAANQFRLRTKSSIAYLSIGLALAALPSPDPVTKALAVGVLIKGLLELDEAIGWIDELVNLLGIVVDVTEVQRLITPLAGELILVKDIQKEVTIKASHRSLVNSDNTSSNNFINSIFKVKNEADKIYDKAVNAISKVKGWFGGTPPQMPSNIVNFNSGSQTKDFALFGRGITLNNFSNNAIQITTTKNLTSVSLKATSTTITTETPFTFNIKYIDPYTGVEINKTVNAIYKPQPTYKLGFLDASPVPNTEIPFQKSTGKFFILLNETGTAATGIDYSKISITGSTNPLITFGLTPIIGTNGSFLLELITNETSKQRTLFTVNYNGAAVQTLAANVNSWEAEAIGEWEQMTVVYYLKSNFPTAPAVCTMEPYRDTVINGLAYWVAIGASSMGSFFKINIGYQGVNTEFMCSNPTYTASYPGTWSVSDEGRINGSFRNPMSFQLVRNQKDYLLYVGIISYGTLVYYRWRKLY